MVVCTSRASIEAREAFGSNYIFVSSVDKMIEKFPLDPTLNEKNHEAFIVMDSDLTRRNEKAFKDAAARKHPNVVIVYIAKRGKSSIQAGNGIDLVLEKPSTDQLRDGVLSVVQELTKKVQVVSAADSVPESVDAFRPKGLESADVATDAYGNELGWGTEAPEEEKEEKTELEPEDLPETPIEEVFTEQPVVQNEQGDELMKRIGDCGKISDVAVFMRELTATQVVADMVNKHAEYADIEDRVKAFKEKAQAIFLDPTISSHQEKMDKIKAIAVDQDFYKAKSATLLEKRMIDLIEFIVDKSVECIKEYDNEFKEAVRKLALSENKSITEGITVARVAGITDERANLMLEIEANKAEAKEIYARLQKAGYDMMAIIAEKDADLTGSELLNNRMKLQQTVINPDELYKGLRKILNSLNEANEEFANIERVLDQHTAMLDKLIDLDKEQLVIMTQIMQALRANNVEDTIIKERMIKRCLRLFVGDKGAGKTVIPYVCSKLKSRSNWNILYMDLTGSATLDDYGEDYMSLDDWMDQRTEQHYCAVVGNLPNTAESAQRLLTALNKAADYYSAINVVITPEQKEILEVFAPDVLVTNYIVPADTGNLDFYRDFIKETHYDNTAQRVIVNKCQEGMLNLIVERLQLPVDLNVHVAMIGIVPSLIECRLRKIKPYELINVETAFSEVTAVC